MYQFISSKTLQKCLRRAEPVYLALVRPTNLHSKEQGMTQKGKTGTNERLQGPVRKDTTGRGDKEETDLFRSAKGSTKRTKPAIGGVQGIVS